MIHIRNIKTHLRDKGDFYLGRTSPLGNPYYMSEESKRDEVCDSFEVYFNKLLKSNTFREDQVLLLRRMRNKHVLTGELTLLCHCYPKRCHTETIRDFILKWEKQPLKTIIAGGRDFSDYGLLESTLDSLPWSISESLNGEALGADSLGAKYMKNKNREDDIKSYPADWNKHGKAAGHIRNTTMANNAQALVAFWDGKSKGTADMISKAKERELLTLVVNY